MSSIEKTARAISDLVNAALSNLSDLLSVLEERAKVREEIKRMLSKELRFNLPGSLWAPLKYTKEIGELPLDDEDLLDLLGVSAGTQVELHIEDAFIRLAVKENGEEKDVEIGSQVVSPQIGGYKLPLFIKLALFFDEHDWEEMKKLATSKLQREKRLVEELKVVESLLTRKQ